MFLKYHQFSTNLNSSYYVKQIFSKIIIHGLIYTHRNECLYTRWAPRVLFSVARLLQVLLLQFVVALASPPLHSHSHSHSHSHQVSHSHLPPLRCCLSPLSNSLHSHHYSQVHWGYNSFPQASLLYLFQLDLLHLFFVFYQEIHLKNKHFKVQVINSIN